MSACLSSSVARLSETRRPVALVLGPSFDALSGVSSHLKLLFASQLSEQFSLVHFRVGSEGRTERRITRLVRLLASPIELAITIRTHRVCIVHVNTSLVPRAFWRDLGYSIVAKLCGARVVYQVHGGALPLVFARGNRLLALGLRKALELADAIVVLAETELSAYRRFVPNCLVVAIANAIDCTPYAAASTSRRYEQGRLRLVYLGRLVKEKGLYELLEATQRAVSLGVELELAIAGGGPDEDRLRHFAANLAVAQVVSFVGPVFGEDKARLLGAADVFVLPTYHPEGLPYALLESMAAGAAVITTKVGAIPDVVVDGVHGFFVPPRDSAAIAEAIARLASDRGRLARMGAASRARVTGAYSLERLARQFCLLYSELSSARGL